MWTEIGNTFGYDQHKHGKQKKWGQHEIYVFDPDHVGVSFMFNPHPTRSSSSPTFNFKQTYIWSAGVPLRQPFQNFLEMSSDSNQKSCLGWNCRMPWALLWAALFGEFPLVWPFFGLFVGWFVAWWKKGTNQIRRLMWDCMSFLAESLRLFMPLDLPMFFCCCGGLNLQFVSHLSPECLPQYLAVNPASVWGLIKKGSLSGVEEGRHKIRGYCKLCVWELILKCVEYCACVCELFAVNHVFQSL